MDHDLNYVSSLGADFSEHGHERSGRQQKTS